MVVIQGSQTRLTIVPTTLECGMHAGFLETKQGDCYRLVVYLTEGGRVDPSALEVDPELRLLLQPYLKALLARAAQAANLQSFATEFVDLVDQTVLPENSHDTKLAPMVPAAFYEVLVAELAELGWARVHAVDAERRTVTLVSSHKSAHGSDRVHELTAQLPPDYPHSPPTCTADLPGDPFEPTPNKSSASSAFGNSSNQSSSLDNSSGAYSLRSIVAQWEDLLARYQAMFDQLDDLDDHAWVLEPARLAPPALSVGKGSPNLASEAASGMSPSLPPLGRPPRSTVHRRIAVAPHASVLFTLDPQQPHAPPLGGLRFLGKESVVGPLRQRASSSRAWDASGATSLRTNLETCLGAELPSPQPLGASHGIDDQTRDGFEVECAICYAYRLPAASGAVESMDTALGSIAPAGEKQGRAAVEISSIPDILCENVRCNRNYHVLCLSQWLQGLPTASRSFGTIFGHCPYCFVPISARV